MANYRAVATGNWSNPTIWGGGAVPPNGQSHNIYSNGFTVTIDQEVNVALLTNASITASFVGGGTSAAALGGFVANSNFNITATIGHNSTGANPSTLQINGTAAFQITGNIVANSSAGTTNTSPVRHSGSGTISIIGNVNVAILNGTPGIINESSGTISLLGNVEGFNYATANSGSILNTSTGTCSVSGNLIVGKSQHAIFNTGGGTINYTGSITGGNASTGVPIANTGAGVININGSLTGGSATVALSNTNSGATIIVTNGVLTASSAFSAISSSGGSLRLSCSFVHAVNGRVPVAASAWILSSTPANAKTRFALNGIGTYVDMFTADNNLGQANPTDVRSGVSYASGTLTGRLTVPARGSVALSVNYGPSMPFTATRSGTTATATLAYSYPLVVGDQITVTGASNSEWNSTYTIISIVSGTSVTFEVPASHSATAGTGANMQTTGTAALDPASIEAAVQSALTAQGLTSARAGNLDNLDATVSSRLAPNGTLATVTTLTNAPASVTASDIWSYATRTVTGGTVDTLTNAPTVPSASAIASQVRSELSVELGRVDAAISTRATPANIPTADIAAIKLKTDALNTTRLAQCSTTEIVGNLLAQANS